MEETRKIISAELEFSKEQCLEAVRLNEDRGEGANTIGYELLSSDCTSDMEDFEVTKAGEEMIDAGRHLNATNEKEQKIIEKLLAGMILIQDGLEPLGLVSKEISWANNLYDEVSVSLGHVPDGDYQTELVDNEQYMTNADMITSIKVRIAHMLESIGL